jgi:uncharacterized cupredoxin-like copper-binding protein
MEPHRNKEAQLELVGRRETLPTLFTGGKDVNAVFRKYRLSLGLMGALVGLVVAVGLLAVRPASAASAHKVILTMKEFKFEPSKIQLKVGEEVELTVRNAGQVTHDWMAGSDLVNTMEEKGFRKDLIALLKPTETGRQYAMERVGMASKADSIKRISEGMEIEPGGEVRLRFKVPASAKGEWQMGCLMTGHYESGMKGTLVIK